MPARTKRCHAVNGDLVTLSHPGLALDVPFTSHVDVVHDAVTHQVLTAADRSAFDFSHTTGEFSVGDLHGYVVEELDNVATKATHVYRAVVDTDRGALATQSYDSVDAVLGLIGALHPTSTNLGIVIDPDDTVRIASAPRVALGVAAGVLEVAPLTAEIIDGLPSWSGTRVAAGELYAGRRTDSSAYLTLVTETCRVFAMLDTDASPDSAAAVLAELEANWAT